MRLLCSLAYDPMPTCAVLLLPNLHNPAMMHSNANKKKAQILRVAHPFGLLIRDIKLGFVSCQKLLETPTDRRARRRAPISITNACVPPVGRAVKRMNAEHANRQCCCRSVPVQKKGLLTFLPTPHTHRYTVCTPALYDGSD